LVVPHGVGKDVTMVAANTDPRPLAVDPDEFRPDPHRGFAKYRPLTGLVDFGYGFPYVTRHPDVQQLLNDPRTRQAEVEGLEFRGITSGNLYDFYANSMLLSNPPRHQLRRAPVARTFAYKLVETWRPRVREIVSALVDAIAPGSEFDFLSEIASPLPSVLIAEILGAPTEDAPKFAEMVYTMTRGIGAFRDAEFPAIEAAAGELNAYVDTLLGERRAAPREDFLTDYLNRVSEAGELTEKEILMQVVSLVIAGSETTRFALTSTVGLLLSDRGQWESLCADPGLVQGAVKESLRYEPPVGSIGRIVMEPLSVDGIALKKGTVLSVSLLSAQRDESVFGNAARFDIARQDHPKWGLSFGYGAHRCLGEALARAELEEALAVLAEKKPNMRLAGPPPKYKGHSGIRGITPMVVAW
jgi:cytochrome P450 family 103